MDLQAHHPQPATVIGLLRLVSCPGFDPPPGWMLQVHKSYLLWGLEYINMTYFGLLGESGSCFLFVIVVIPVLMIRIVTVLLVMGAMII